MSQPLVDSPHSELKMCGAQKEWPKRYGRILILIKGKLCDVKSNAFFLSEQTDNRTETRRSLSNAVILVINP